MLPRMPGQMFAWAVFCGFSCGSALGQQAPPVHSIETLTASATVVVRGKIVGQDTHAVSLKASELLKGQGPDLIRFRPVFADSDPYKATVARWQTQFYRLEQEVAAGVVEPAVLSEVERQLRSARAEEKAALAAIAKAKALLGDWEKAHTEILCFLTDEAAHLGAEKHMAGNDTMCSIGIFSLVKDAEQRFPFNCQLRAPKTPDEFLKQVRAECSREVKAAPSTYRMELPGLMARRTCWAGPVQSTFYLDLPRDERLESLARRLVQSPKEVLEKGEEELKDSLRIEGVRALRHFPSQQNLAIINAWRQTGTNHDLPADALLPQAADQRTVGARSAGDTAARLPAGLADVPQVFLQQPLPSKMNTQEAQLRTACTIDMIHFLNRQKIDGFLLALTERRPDLAGLPFMMGDACRMNEDTGRHFAAARTHLRAASDSIERNSTHAPERMAAFAKIEAIHRTQISRALADAPLFSATMEKLSKEMRQLQSPARIAVVMQSLGTDSAETRSDLVEYLDGKADVAGTRALANLAVFSQEAEVRQAAVRALKLRRDRDYTDILLAGLNYPWPQIAGHAAEAIVQLGRTDLVPQLIDVLENPDPRAPRRQQFRGKETIVVRELVRLNHHHNCLLCHAPATAERDKLSIEEARKLEPLSAQVPVPSEAMNAYYSPNMPDILVRFDVTYLRQDFSLNLPVADSDPWPKMQRYDFLVRTREVTEKEADRLRALLPSEADSPYRQAALSALRRLTGRDEPPSAANWRQASRERKRPEQLFTL